MRTQLSALVLLTAAVAPAAVLTGTVVEDHSNNPLALAGVRIVRISPHTVIAELDTDGLEAEVAEQLAGHGLLIVSDTPMARV